MSKLAGLKRLALTLVAVGAALLYTAAPAQAIVVLDFGTGDAGSAGTVTVSGSNVSGSGIAIDTLTVTGDGAFDGVYDVDGIVNGSGESGVGSLDFNTATNTITITGSISCQSGSGGACTPTQILLGSTIVSSTTLLGGTGAFSNLTISANGVLAFVTFNAPDQKAPSLLSVLGISGNQWQLAGFSLSANNAGTGNPYTAFSTDISNTQVPEPGSMVLFGTGIMALGRSARRRWARK
jgi:hypothetical protein